LGEVGAKGAQRRIGSRKKIFKMTENINISNIEEEEEEEEEEENWLKANFPLLAESSTPKIWLDEGLPSKATSISLAFTLAILILCAYSVQGLWFYMYHRYERDKLASNFKLQTKLKFSS